jgi:hypothetical protein
MAETIQKINKPERSEYKGNPILSIPQEGGYPFSFGIKKAKAIIVHLQAIKDFIAEDETHG